MRFIPLDKKPMLDFIYQSIDIYAKDLFDYEEFDNYVDARDEAKREVTSLIPHFVKQDHHYIYNITQQNKIIGNLWYIIHAHPQTDHCDAFLNYISISPQLRQQGLATKAMQLFEDEINTLHHCNHFTLYVFAKNHAAIKLYQKLGYRIVHEAAFNNATETTRYKMIK